MNCFCETKKTGTHEAKREKCRFLRNVAACLASSFLIVLTAGSCRSPEQPRSGIPWSVRMTESVIERVPQPWFLDPQKKTPQWEYTYGLVLQAMLGVWNVTHEESILRYVQAYFDHFIAEDGTISTYNPEEYNIDRINAGKPLFALYRITGQEKYRKAIEILRNQMRTHPRTNEGGFWHKKIYPHQMWLDGLYMASPFLAEYAQTFQEPGLFEDVARQFVIMESHAREEKTGLLYHGWDESRQQKWADPQTGLSSQFWGRSVGWFAMALVDVLDFFPENHPRRADLISILNRLMTAVMEVQDKESGLWYQVLDKGTHKGNYLESSASCMFVYALSKAAHKGYIHPAFMHIAEKGYQGILDRFIEIGKNGTVQIRGACAVAGLGGSPYRDGSYEYYIQEKRASNDPKAIGPFILASLEMEAG